MSVLTVHQAPQEFLPERKWLGLYNVMLRPRTQAVIQIDEADLAPIQRVFPEELMNIVFSYLSPYNLGRAACVCKQWKHLCEHSRHWEAACREAFGTCHKDVACSQQLVRQRYRSSWQRLFLEVPHLRFEGLYVSRNTYIRQGVAEWRREKTCHLVTYFRYFRFFRDGTLLYRTSPMTVKQVAKSMMRNPCQVGTSKQHKYEQHVHTGRYVIKVGARQFAWQ
eukprot:GHRR01006892.1.p1 GENE.GHRR01006892.1~~GHRR01006892.1.p1  ORF type:complete len:222 (+),score=44.07 GHRR01006892.1:225-890(+)